MQPELPLSPPQPSLPSEQELTAVIDDLRAAQQSILDEISEVEEELIRRAEARRWELGVLPVFRPLLPHARYKGAFGGRGGAKSHFFAELLIHRMENEPLRAVCIREVQKSLDQSVKRLLEDKIAALGLSESFTIKQASIHSASGGLIIFQGMQDHTNETIKSLEGYDVAWVEEAQTLSERSLGLLRPTIRKPGSELWFSWNPRKETDPVDAFFRGSAGPPPSTTLVRTGYADNPYLSDALKAELEWDRGRDHELFDHVWGGEYEKRSDANVFKNWKVLEFDTPDDADFLLGSDWGFAVDPSALVRCFTRPNVPRTLFIDAECYELGCEIDDTPDLFDSLVCGCQKEWRKRCTHPQHGWARKRRILADSARPDTISYMQRHKYPLIEPAKKGKDSVEEGIKFLQSYDIVVHPRCAHTVQEFKYYNYKVDKQTGTVLPELVDAKNHTIDSVRYAVETLRAEEEPSFAVY